MPGPVEVYVGLGSNLGDPREHLRAGLEGMARLEGFEPLAYSSPYATAPVGPVEQAPFINAVAHGRFEGDALELLDGLLAVEKIRGRTREVHWGPRTLDLDLLLFGREVIDLPRLKIPHPEMASRAFVLVPLMELAPDLVLPVWNKTAFGLFDLLSPEEKRSQKIERISWGFGALSSWG